MKTPRIIAARAVGDSTLVIEKSDDDSETIWYKAKFASSGIEGWIHENFVEFSDPG